MNHDPLYPTVTAGPMQQRPGDGAKDGDIFYNPYFGDYWIVKNEMFVLINDGWSVPLSDPVGFKQVGHIEIGGDAEWESTSSTTLE